MRLSVIIPVLNEQDNIDMLVGELNTFFLQRTDYSAEVLFVNDGSTDNTVEKLKTAKHFSYVARIISLSKNFGSHAALRAGIERATGEYITFMYADLQDPIELLDSMVAKMKDSQADICWAYRNSTETTRTEKLFSKGYAYMMQKYAVSNFPKNGFDIVMFSRKVQNCLNNNIESNSSIFIQVLSLGFKQSAVTYYKKARLVGKSKWTVSKKIKLFIDSFVAFSFAPIRLVSLVGITFFLLGLIWTAYIVVRTLLFDDLASGWPALMSVLMLGFGITNISLGIIAEYLWRTLDASRKRPVFVIEEATDLNILSKAKAPEEIHVL